jgi:hypothetical protein
MNNSQKFYYQQRNASKTYQQETYLPNCERKIKKTKHLFLLSHRMPSGNTHHKYLIHHVKIGKTCVYFLAHAKEGNCLPTGQGI